MQRCHRAVAVHAAVRPGDPQQHPRTESYWGNVNPVGLRSVYDEAKRYAEALAFAYRRQDGADVEVVRIFNTYGPGMRAADGRMVPALCRQAGAARGAELIEQRLLGMSVAGV
ncbi:NAD-dependent epimerase/dehydratase family protein [Mycobacterium simiae]|uniref:NAD-dependent epimerase/dehydratase family protein n=1 Tax=Mycobacterium simiae TaxID=1784 RepID=A0A5B1BMZ3_MYCSI|nr:NAD-dependent epimerase/dehydratase family protein [Mycobacterium simiae]